MSSEALWEWLKQLVVIGGPSVVISLGGFKWIGEKWLESKFQSQQERLKHEHQKELEAVRHSIQKTYSRVSKIHEREFEVLPKAWFLLNQAYGSAARATAPFRQYSNVTTMPDAQLCELLHTLKLTPFQRTHLMEIENDGDRQSLYNKALDGIALDEADEHLRLLTNYLIEHQIFMSGDVSEQFDATTQTMRMAVYKFSSGKEDVDGDRVFKAIEEIEAVKEVLPALEKSLQERLHYGDA